MICPHQQIIPIRTTLPSSSEFRLNQYIALSTGLSRRESDQAIAAGRVMVNGRPAVLGSRVSRDSVVTLDGKLVKPARLTYIMLNKPIGYLCSRRSQGAPTIYELLPSKYRHLNSAGRLDKDTSGLIILTNDGYFAETLMHPRYGKSKIYQVQLNRPIVESDKFRLKQGVNLDDGISIIRPLEATDPLTLKISLTEGRNRQIRRTFRALGYEVVKLHRLAIGGYRLGRLKPGELRSFKPKTGT